MKNGLYKATFGTPLGTGTGIVTLRDGQISGGDADIFYWGEYTADGQSISCQLNTAKHSSNPGVASVFGVDNVSVHLSGNINGDLINLSGQHAGVSFQTTLKCLRSL
jgi:hypothetical protein